MAIHLLTGREVIRTHKHWRVFMKRPVWSAQEALRRKETRLTQAAPVADHCLTMLHIDNVDAAGQDGRGP